MASNFDDYESIWSSFSNPSTQSPERTRHSLTGELIIRRKPSFRLDNPWSDNSHPFRLSMPFTQHHKIFISLSDGGANPTLSVPTDFSPCRDIHQRSSSLRDLIQFLVIGLLDVIGTFIDLTLGKSIWLVIILLLLYVSFLMKHLRDVEAVLGQCTQTVTI